MPRFDGRIPAAAHPAVSAVAVSPNDTTDLGSVRALYIGSTGSISVLLHEDDTPVTFANVPAGALLPIAVRVVRTTGTTASNILALY